MSKDRSTFRHVLSILESRSTCSRIQVAALLVRDGHIIGTGWNGVASGEIHCSDVFPDPTSIEDFSSVHREFSIAHERHAEDNALRFAQQHNIDVSGCDLYCSYTPCSNCADEIIAAGIARVFYKTVYDRETVGVAKLKQAGIPVIRI